MAARRPAGQPASGRDRLCSCRAVRRRDGHVAALVALAARARGLPAAAQAQRPPLIALISAIGASFVLAELMGLRDSRSPWFGLDDNLDAYVGRPRNNTGLPESSSPSASSRSATTRSPTSTSSSSSARIVMMVMLDQFVRRSRLGRGIRAVAQDPEAAALMGVNRDRVIQVDLPPRRPHGRRGRGVYMMKIGITRYDAGFILGVKAFTAAVLGGIGNLRGALLGGFVLGLAENYGSALVGTQWKDVVAFVLLIVILLFRPTGLLGESLGKARA